MARRPMMAANWKMNKTVREAEEYTAALLPRAADAEEDVDVVVCAPHTCLHEVGRMAGDSAVIAGAQNFYYEDSGAYTGEVSAPMLLDVEAGAVIVGHSERREVFGETDEMVARKTKRAVEAGILPIVCVGETKEERDAGSMWDKVSGQVERVIEELHREDQGPAEGDERRRFLRECPYPLWRFRQAGERDRDHGPGRYRRRPGGRSEPRGRVLRRADRGRAELRRDSRTVMRVVR